MSSTSLSYRSPLGQGCQCAPPRSLRLTGHPRGECVRPSAPEALHTGSETAGFIHRVSRAPQGIHDQAPWSPAFLSGIMRAIHAIIIRGEDEVVSVHELLELGIRERASDLLVKAGAPPAMRVDGLVRSTALEALTAE